jgi:hypothetical protein
VHNKKYNNLTCWILLDNRWLVKKLEELSNTNKTLTGCCRGAGEYALVYKAKSRSIKN